MKNPFEKKDHSTLIAAVVIGGIVTAALTYLLLTETGDEIFAKIKLKVKDTAKDLASGIISDKTGISKKTVKSAANAVIK